jgi:hypothetical protein
MRFDKAAHKTFIGILPTHSLKAFFPDKERGHYAVAM